MPGIEHIGISRKITDPAERDRLRELIRSHAQPGEGFIVRTAAIGEKDEDLVGDVVFLRRLWEGIQAKADTVPAPGLVWQDLRLLQKIMRDLFREEVSTFWVDDDAAHREVMSFVENLHPEWSNRVKRFTSDLPIFEAFGIEAEIDSARQPKVFLKHGGSIVLNQTEALVSVDVNTGKFVGKKDLEETVYLTNLEAIPEIVRQLRLRNLGGIVVIDFIDMVDPVHREEVLTRFQEELKRDRNHARAGGISEFGLVELTRKRTGPSLERLLTQPCPTCNGAGRMPEPRDLPAPGLPGTGPPGRAAARRRRASDPAPGPGRLAQSGIAGGPHAVGPPAGRPRLLDRARRHAPPCRGDGSSVPGAGKRLRVNPTEDAVERTSVL